MKVLVIILCFCTGFLMVNIPKASGQKQIRLDGEFQLNSDFYSVKRKGMKAVGKYQFGPFKIISGKSGWAKGKSKTDFWGRYTEASSAHKLSFVFVGHDSDTAYANSAVTRKIETDNANWVSRKLLNWNTVEVTKNEGLYETEFSFSNDTSTWSLILTFPVYVGLDEEDEDKRVVYSSDQPSLSSGILTNNVRQFEIHQTRDRDDGKNSMFVYVSGYIFYENSKPLAAVQTFPSNGCRVWIRKDLNPETKFVLAAGIAAFLGKMF